MDPLSVLSIAAAVAQFIDFATGVVSTSSEIFRSAHGASCDKLILETTCTTLKDFSERLMSRTETAAFGACAQDLKQLASQCKADCDELLDTLQRLKVGEGKHRLWRSIKAGLKTVWDAQKIGRFEERLDKAQNRMILLVSDFTWAQAKDLEERLSRLQLHETAKIDQLTEELKALGCDVNRFGSIVETFGIVETFDKVANRVETFDIVENFDKVANRVETFDIVENFDKVANREEKEKEPDILQRTNPVGMVDEIVSRLGSVITAQHRLSKQNTILKSLNFKSRAARHEAIPETYAKTYDWVFQSSLSKWLREDSDMFWVSGRAGSGKSTLMKFIVDEPQTAERLRDWAQPKSVALIAHYFWSPGTEMQRSQRGLLQTLLYDIFRKCPDCIPLVCPSRWGDNDSDPDDATTQPWSTAELSDTLKSLSNHGDLLKRFCWFIDGLDEYEGEHAGLCDILVNFSRSPNFKLCIASRPLNIFQDAFKDCSRLSVHDYNAEDIAQFTRGRLESHHKWATFARQAEKENLISTIRDKANGVFLWVYLVTRSLQDGLTNDDDLEELVERVESLPTQLEELFKRMLDSVDKIYHGKMAGNFLLALYTSEPLAIDIYAFHDNEYQNDKYATEWPVKALTEAKLDAVRSRILRRINARSQGLLEGKGASVEFLHRTVRDFLRTNEMRQYLTLKVPAHFDPAFSLVKAYLAMIKSTDFSIGTASIWDTSPKPVRREAPGDNRGWLIYLIDECFRLASNVSQQHLENLEDILDDLEKSVVQMFGSRQACFYYGKCRPALLVREQILRSKLRSHVALKVARSDDYLASFEAPPLFIASRPPLISIEMVTLLLSQAGCDPNEVCRAIPESTPWLALLTWASPWSIPQCGENSGYFHFAIENSIFSSFLAKGADPNAYRPYDASRTTAFALYLLSIFHESAWHYGSTSHRVEQYLHNLAGFINAGADMQTHIGNIGECCFDKHAGLVRLGHSGTATTTLTEAFFCCLRTVREDAESSGRTEFVAQVIEKLIRGEMLGETSTLAIPDTIRTKFPPPIAQRLLGLLRELRFKPTAKRWTAEDLSRDDNFKRRRVDRCSSNSSTELLIRK